MKQLMKVYDTSALLNLKDELKLDEEIERAKTREDEIDGQLLDPSKNPYTMSAAVGKDDSNLILKSKDGDEAHFIKIMFDGNFGEI